MRSDWPPEMSFLKTLKPGGHPIDHRTDVPFILNFREMTPGLAAAERIVAAAMAGVKRRGDRPQSEIRACLLTSRRAAGNVPAGLSPDIRNIT